MSFAIPGVMMLFCPLLDDWISCRIGVVRQETRSYSTCFGKRPIHYAYKVFEYASGLTSTPKAELFCSCNCRKFIGQNKVKILSFQVKRIGCPSYHAATHKIGPGGRAFDSRVRGVTTRAWTSANSWNARGRFEIRSQLNSWLWVVSRRHVCLN